MCVTERGRERKTEREQARGSDITIVTTHDAPLYGAGFPRR
jgi:hypothetical protein